MGFACIIGFFGSYNLSNMMDNQNLYLFFFSISLSTSIACIWSMF